MAKNYSTPYDSVAESSKEVKISVLNSSDLSLTSEKTDEVTEQTSYSPLSTPELWTFGCKPVQDVYKNTNIQASARPSSSRGVQIMVRHDAITTVTDSADANYLKQLPMACWTCIRVPLNELITEDQILAELKRALAGLFGDGQDVSSARIAELVRGALRADN